MRKINPNSFRIATRGTSREINRQIVLNLVRTHQPISRADLARIMSVRRGVVSRLINELLAEALVFEGTTGESHRGRKPTFLYIDSRERCVVAVDIRASRTYIQVTDLVGRQLVAAGSLPSQRDPKRLIAELSRRIKKILSDHKEVGTCEGIGVVVPGMTDSLTSRVINAPTLDWHDVDIKEALSAATGLPVHVENSGRACALAQMWATRGIASAIGDLVFVSVSDGVGVGIVINGEILRGRHNIAGEFGHVPLSIDGPRCSCGATGCWEAYISNLATLSRYFGRNLQEMKAIPAEIATFTIEDLIVRARAGDAKAVAALQSTARYLGLGLASIINVIDPTSIYIGGEIMAAWDLIEPDVRNALAERALSPTAVDTDFRVVPAEDQPRLRGAAALVSAPAYAAPAVA
ncbi:MAG TPA: ROK family transcriptional regulator [Blastocatellia bacterium]|jgi:predicted NBD/HSP70 family sugar kinase|nr:ROK family transcriptional regulator [Blastocatellia bacterium]